MAFHVIWTTNFVWSLNTTAPLVPNCRPTSRFGASKTFYYQYYDNSMKDRILVLLSLFTCEHSVQSVILSVVCTCYEQLLFKVSLSVVWKHDACNCLEAPFCLLIHQLLLKQWRNFMHVTWIVQLYNGSMSLLDDFIFLVCQVEGAPFLLCKSKIRVNNR